MRIDYKFLSWLVVGLLCTSVAIAALHGLQVERLDMTLLQKAREAAKNADATAAVQYYSRYLGSEVDSVDVRFEFAGALNASGNQSEAVEQLRRVLRQAPNRKDARSLLAYLLADTHQYSDAKSHLTSLLKHDPDNPEYRWMLGSCQRELSNFDLARDQLSEAVRLDPGHPQYALDFANLLTHRFGDSESAKQTLDQMVQHASRNPQAYRVRASWSFERHEQSPNMDPRERSRILDDARKDAEKAVSLAPEDLMAVHLASSIALRSGRTDQALPMLLRCLKTNPTVPTLYGSAAEFELREGRINEAIEHLERGLRVNPGDPDLIWNLAQLRLDEGHFSAFDELYRELVRIQYADAPLRYLRAKKLHRQGGFRNAADVLEDSRALFVQNGDLIRQADFLLADCYGKLKQYDRQLESLRRVVSAAPLWTMARQSLALTLLRTGQIPEALQEYRQLANHPNPPPGSLVTLARLVFLNTVNRQTSTPDWSEFESILRILSNDSATGDDVAILRAEQLAATGKTNQAEQILNEQIECAPNSISLRQALIGLQILDKNWDRSLETLRLAETDLGDSAILRLERARCLVRRDGQKVDRQSLERISRAPIDWIQDEKIALAAGMAKHFLSLGENAHCERCARFVADSSYGATDLAIHLLLFDLALRSRDVESMAKSLSRVRELEGKGPLWHVGEAVRLSVEAFNHPDQQQSLAAKAIEHLNLAEADRSSWSRIPRLQAEIYDALGTMDLAIERYLKAIRLGEQDPRIVSRTMFLLFDQGRFIEAEGLFRKLDQKRVPFSSELIRVASEISLKLENFDRALTLAKDWAQQSDKAQDRIWLAQMYSLAGDYKSSERTFRQAIELDSASPAAWVSLVQMYGRAGEMDLAEATIEKSRTRIRPNSREFAIAQCFESIGNAGRAAHHYQKSIQSSPNDSKILRRYAEFYLKQRRTAESQPILETLSSERFDDQPIDQAWARRNLALLIGGRGTRSEFLRACRLVASNRKRLGKTIADQRVLGIIHGSRPDRTSQLDAIRILRETVEKQSDYSADDHFLLASLYRMTGDWTNYSRQMRSLLGQGGADDPRFVADYARALLDRGETDEAELWCRRLEETSPGSLASATIKAHLLFQTDQTMQLSNQLDKMAATGTGKRLSARLAEYFADQLAERNEHEHAQRLIQRSESWFAQLSTADSEHSDALAAHYARQGKLSTALRLVSKSRLTEDQLVRLGRDAMKYGPIAEQELQPLIERIRSSPDFATSIPLKMCLGDLYGWIGRWNDAAQTYEQVLELGPDCVPALNNLAMVCALSGERKDRATQAINMAVDLVGESEQLLDTRGIVLLALGKPQAAENDFRVALNAGPRADRHFHLAWALLDQRRFDEAQEMFQQAREGGLAADGIHPLERPVFERMRRLF